MTTYDYDLFVIGAGSGGVRAARMSGGFGARVAIAEARKFGGTCVNAGCIPKKLLVYAAGHADDLDDAAGYGFRTGPREFDWPTLIARKDAEIARLNGVYERLLRNAGVEPLRGRALIEDPHTVCVEGRRFSAARILVATGSLPRVPLIEGRELAITSNEAFHLDRLPERVILVGGGYVAVEFAGIFHGLGAKVTQLHRGLHFLRGFDDDVRSFLAAEMRRKGIDLRFNATLARIERRQSELMAELADGTELGADCILFATGRVPATRGLGLEEAGVELGPEGEIIVNEQFQSSVPSIFALGDVIDGMALTPVALAEAMAFARSQFRGEPVRMDYGGIPTAVWSRPSVGMVGLTEAQAREVHGRVDIYASTFQPLRHALSGRAEKTLMKLVVDRATDRVVGCHMVGPEAGEIIQGLAIALKCGATKAQFDATIGIHPTSAEEFVTMRERLPDPAP